MGGLRAHGAAYEAAFAAMATAGKMPPDLLARYPLLLIGHDECRINDRAIERGIDSLIRAGRGRVDASATAGLVITGAREQLVRWLSELAPFVPDPLPPERRELLVLLARAVRLIDLKGSVEELHAFQRDAMTALRNHPAQGGPNHGDKGKGND